MEPTELNLVEVVLELNEDGKAVHAVSSAWNTLLFFQHCRTPAPSMSKVFLLTLHLLFHWLLSQGSLPYLP